MDEVLVNGNDRALDDAENDDLFAIPPPLGSLLDEDPLDLVRDIDEQNDALNLNDNVAHDPAQESNESNEKKKKKRASGPRVNLNEDRLCSTNGIAALKNLCSDVRFRGEGHEVSDLNMLLERFENWAQCLMPKWPFANLVKKCELLGSKSRCKNELKRVRQSDDDDVLRGEPEDEDTAIDAGETTANEEHSTQHDLGVAGLGSPEKQTEKQTTQMSEEQLERIQKNRERALARLEAKKRRLAEESQTQLEDQTDDELWPSHVNSLEQQDFTNLMSENTENEETPKEHQVNTLNEVGFDIVEVDEVSEENCHTNNEVENKIPVSENDLLETEQMDVEGTSAE